VTAALGDIDKIICPCKDCRNVYSHSSSDVVVYLVTRGMDEAYKLQSDWYHHGDSLADGECEREVNHWNEEIHELYKAAEYNDQELATNGDLGDNPMADLGEIAEGEDKIEDEFLAKLANAETPLYPDCLNHSKLSAIVSLFWLKTKNGWSHKSFDELLETVPKMLPKDNVLHTSLYDVKKFLKSFDRDIKRFMRVQMTAVFSERSTRSWKIVPNAMLQGGRLICRRVKSRKVFHIKYYGTFQ